MKVGKGFHKTLYSLICGIALLAGLCVPKTVMASSTPETGSISLSYDLADVEFGLYKVGMIDKDYNLVLTGDFANYSVNKDDDNAAQTLESYVNRDNIEPFMKLKTDENGKLKFDSLEFAAYLVCGERTVIDEMKYIPAPVLVYIPAYAGGQRITDIDISMKYEKEDLRPKVNLSVLKVWDDAGNENARPSQITVELLKNGAVYKTVNLNAENNWKYQWNDLDGYATWMITEKSVPAGYQVSISKSGSAFVVTNTSTIEEPEELTPTPSPTKPGELPRTGQLWWPVFALVFGGLLCMVIGLILKRTEHE